MNPEDLIQAEIYNVYIQQSYITCKFLKLDRHGKYYDRAYFQQVNNGLEWNVLYSETINARILSSLEKELL